ncbi:MAG: bifunctional salicylyl-CoA 5-hydroxylase/oxidoreductase [Polyangiaceae bacterium]
MRISVVGGGPAGLYFSILQKKRAPESRITLYERNAPGETFGWGVVFSDETLSFFEEADPETHVEITKHFQHWNDIEIHFKGRTVRTTGNGFSGISRKTLLDILRARAEGLGIELYYRKELSFEGDSPLKPFEGSDLIIAADGVNSLLRKRYASAFQPTVDVRRCKYIWLGVKKVFDAFTFLYETCEAGTFQVHAYRFDEDTSTFIVETDPETWTRAGLDRMPESDQLRFLERLFARYLDGKPLLPNKSSWLQFGTLKCKTWSHDNMVLLGDSAHTAHFSIGSGTKLAMEDAIALTGALERHSNLRIPEALVAYEQERRIIVEKTQAAAQDSLSFFENTSRYMHMDPLEFSFRLMTRSKRIGYENMAVRDAQYVERVTEDFTERAKAPKSRHGKAKPPMFTPFSLRGMQLANRVVVSPMCMYSAVDGAPSDIHLVHLGSRAVGGAGLLITEMTDVAADGRITPGCTGMYDEAHVVAWRRITDFVHQQSAAKIAVQLGHAGRKGSTKPPWEGQDVPLDSGNWPLLSASALAYAPRNQVPRAMTREDMDRVKGEFVRAVTMADRAGFDMVELHFAHGYLLASFISPLTNVRTDEYGGSLENRMRFPLEIVDATRAAWPKDKPMSCRISATDWVEGGTTGEDAVEIAKLLHAHGIDIVHVSTGQTTEDGKPVFYGRMFQTPFADQIRNDTGVPTIAVGNITSADQVNTILAGGRADLVALARPHLRDPYFTFHAAEEAGEDELPWPSMYGLVRPKPKA